MPKQQWGEEAGRRYELAPSQWARWLHAKTRSGVKESWDKHILFGEPWLSGCTLSCKMDVIQTNTAGLMSQWMETKLGFKVDTGWDLSIGKYYCQVSSRRAH